jgi:hypothetical protein
MDGVPCHFLSLLHRGSQPRLLGEPLQLTVRKCGTRCFASLRRCLRSNKMLSLHCRLLMKVVAIPVLPLRPCTAQQPAQHQTVSMLLWPQTGSLARSGETTASRQPIHRRCSTQNSDSRWCTAPIRLEQHSAKEPTPPPPCHLAYPTHSCAACCTSAHWPHPASFTHRAPNSVHVVLDFLGQVVVDDVLHTWEVQTLASNISGNQHIRLACSPAQHTT